MEKKEGNNMRRPMRKRLSDRVQNSYRDIRNHHMSKGDMDSALWYLGFLVRKGYAEHLLAMDDLTEEERKLIEENRK